MLYHSTAPGRGGCHLNAQRWASLQRSSTRPPGLFCLCPILGAARSYDSWKQKCNNFHRAGAGPPVPLPLLRSQSQPSWRIHSTLHRLFSLPRRPPSMNPAPPASSPPGTLSLAIHPYTFILFKSPQLLISPNPVPTPCASVSAPTTLPDCSVFWAPTALFKANRN